MRKIIVSVGALGLITTAATASAQQGILILNHDYGFDGVRASDVPAAQRSCVAAGGTFTNAAGRLRCTNAPQPPGGGWRRLRPNAR